MPEFNYSQITKYLYLGSRFYDSKNMEMVVRDGIRAVVDLNLEKMDRPRNLLAYLWLPARDFSPPSVEQFFIGIDFIDHLVRRRIKTYVHCNVGFGRAPTLLAAYLVAIRGYTLAEAVIYLSHRRPGIHPNPGQIDGIKKFIQAFGRYRKSSQKFHIA
ncbi:MAG: dual specificity protein phosphatase [Patescibacteria group bacterium]|jgi:protein-tyrosine phosphatase